MDTLAVGICIGIPIDVAMQNIGVGIAIGVAGKMQDHKQGRANKEGYRKVGEQHMPVFLVYYRQQASWFRLGRLFFSGPHFKKPPSRPIRLTSNSLSFQTGLWEHRTAGILNLMVDF